MGRWGNAVVLAVGSSCAAFACSLTTSLDDLSNGTSASTPVDDSGSPNDSGGSDRDRDASHDAGFGTDAGVDAEPYCTPSATFCDQFDRGSLRGDWDEIPTREAELALDTAQSLSPTTSLRATLLDTMVDGYSFLTHTVTDSATQAPKRVVLRYALYLTAPPDRFITLSELAFTSGSTERNVAIQIDPSGMLVHEGQFENGTSTGGEDHPTIADVRLGEWNRIELTVTLTGTPRLSLKLNGAPAVDDKATLAFAPAPLRIELGAVYAAQGQAYTYWIDDLRVDATE